MQEAGQHVVADSVTAGAGFGAVSSAQEAPDQHDCLDTMQQQQQQQVALVPALTLGAVVNLDQTTACCAWPCNYLQSCLMALVLTHFWLPADWWGCQGMRGTGEQGKRGKGEEGKRGRGEQGKRGTEQSLEEHPHQSVPNVSNDIVLVRVTLCLLLGSYTCISAFQAHTCHMALLLHFPLMMQCR